jgi:hypothetical protein
MSLAPIFQFRYTLRPNLEVPMRLASGLVLILSLSAVGVMAETSPEEIPAPRDTSITRSILVPPPVQQPPANLPQTLAAPAPAVILPQNNSNLYDMAGELPAILRALEMKRFSSDAGHSMAASLLANCSTGIEPQKKADMMEVMYRAILNRRFPAIVVSIQAMGLAAMEPQISLLAATLVCKQGERDAAQTLDSLDSAFKELQAAPYGLTEFFHNLIVAANLMY